MDLEQRPHRTAAAAPADSAYYYPPRSGEDWQRVSPAQAGWNPALLAEALRYAAERNSTAVLILYQGRVLAERYYRGWDLHTADAIASAAKSVVAFLVGVAQEQRRLKIEHPVSRYLGRGWSQAGPAVEDRITLRHLLTMTSGLDDALRPVALPGTLWYYNTPAYQQLKRVLERATGLPLNAYTRRVLWERIGMQDSVWGLTTLRASARDMARFGLLVLGGGMWDGQSILGQTKYLQTSLSSSQALNPAYGYLWWLNGKNAYVLPGQQGSGAGWLIPQAPADMVSALGKGDKKIYVVKSLDLVVVRHGGPAMGGPMPALSSFDNQWWRKLMAAAPTTRFLSPRYLSQGNRSDASQRKTAKPTTS